MKQILVTLVIVIFHISCATNSLQPIESEYLKTTVGSFLLNRDREVQYVVWCDVIKEVPEEIVLRIEYENPVNRAKPIVQESKLSPGQKVLKLESPVLPGIQNLHIYEVKIVGTVKSTGAQIFQHNQAIKFVIPPGF